MIIHNKNLLHFLYIYRCIFFNKYIQTPDPMSCTLLIIQSPFLSPPLQSFLNLTEKEDLLSFLCSNNH